MNLYIKKCTYKILSRKQRMVLSDFGQPLTGVNSEEERSDFGCI